MEIQVFWTIFIFIRLFRQVSMSYGTHFVIVCPQGDTVPQIEYMLYITLPNNNADINVTAPLLGVSFGTYSNVLKSETREVSLSSTYMFSGTGVSNKTILVTSTTDVSVYVIARNGGDGYTAIPSPALGNEHYIVTYCDEYNPCQFSVSAGIGAVQVEITLAIFNGDSVILNSVTYQNGDVISQTLTAFQTLQIRCNSDLTGTLVISNKNVFVVGGGALGMNISERHLLMEQIPPVQTFGREILTVPSKYSESIGDDYCFVSSQPQTTIQIGGIVRRYLKTGGDWFTLRLNGTQFIFADKPILVMRKTQTVIGSAVTEWSTMLVMIPKGQFLVGGTQIVLLPGVQAISSLVISVVRSLTDTLEVNADSQTGFTTIPGKELFIKYTSTTAPTVKQEVIKTNVRGLGVYYQIETNGYSVSLIGAMNFYNTNSECVASDTSIGDMVDNDCDGLIDEDVCPSNGSPAEYVGKDCQLIVSGESDSFGLRFIAVLPENIEIVLTGTTSLVFSTFSTEEVRVNVTTPRNTSILDTHILMTVTAELDALHELELSGSGVSDKGILIEASHEISAYTITDIGGTFKSSGATRLLPVEALGQEYYAVTVCESSACQIQIVAAHPFTVVQVKLNLQDVSLTVDYGGITYHHGDIIAEYLHQYQAWQLQAPIDITGSRITSNKPIAVFSGGQFTSFLTGQQDDHFNEQLHPVKSWGNSFALVQAPHDNCVDLASRNCDDVIRLISHQGNTTINIRSPSGNQDYNLHFPGDWINVDLRDWAHIESTKPISVIHMITGEVHYDGGMAVVSPISEYSQGDVINIMNIADHTVEMVIITESDYKNDILLNGGNLVFTDNFDVNMTYLKTVVTPGGNFAITTQNATAGFGGYIFSYKMNAASYFFSLVSHHSVINIGCEKSNDSGGDGLDNDCDGKIDEEICDFNIFPQDDDLDGLIDEDCFEIIQPSSTILSSSMESTVLETSGSSEFVSASNSEYTTPVPSDSMFQDTLSTMTSALDTSSVLVLTQSDSVSTILETSGSSEYLSASNSENTIPVPSASMFQDTLSTMTSALDTSSVPVLTQSDSVSTILETSGSSEFLSASNSENTIPVPSASMFQDTLSTMTSALDTSSVPVLTQSDSVSTILETSGSSEFLSASNLVPSDSLFQDTLSTMTPDLETSSVLVLTQGDSVCTCGCVTWSITTSLDSASLVEVTESIKTELIVDSKEMSKTIRKLTSASDPRPSAQTVGYFGIAVISGIFIGIFILDAGALFTDLKMLVHVLKAAKRG